MIAPNVQPFPSIQLTSLEVQKHSKQSHKRKQTSTFKRNAAFRAELSSTRSFFPLAIQWPLGERWETTGFWVVFCGNGLRMVQRMMKKYASCWHWSTDAGLGLGRSSCTCWCSSKLVSYPVVVLCVWSRFVWHASGWQGGDTKLFGAVFWCTRDALCIFL